MQNIQKNNHLSLNKGFPYIMHIDLNSCFATIEQQSNRLLRGRPVGVAAYDTPHGFILASSYQAKAKGVKLGVKVAEARQLCPDIVIVTPDPPKYREAHHRFYRLLLDYTDAVTPKSIDEFVIDVSGSLAIQSGLSLEEIALGIKSNIFGKLGEAVTVNVGIGPNRFLAKFASGFDKPNGMRVIDHTNLRQVYQTVDLLDLPGINVGYKSRLTSYGIKTPLDFLEADQRLLQKVVFKSINGLHWYKRLRGYEVDDYKTKRRQIGHQYALPKKTSDKLELARLLLKLCEKVGRRLRAKSLTAGGVHLYLDFVNYQEEVYHGNGFVGGDSLTSQRAWHKSYKLDHRLYSTDSIYHVAKYLLDLSELHGDVRGMSINVFDLETASPEQLSLFESDRAVGSDRRLSDAMDEINNRYGEFVLTPAKMMGMQGEILDRIAFGGIDMT